MRSCPRPRFQDCDACRLYGVLFSSRWYEQRSQISGATYSRRQVSLLKRGSWGKEEINRLIRDAFVSWLRLSHSETGQTVYTASSHEANEDEVRVQALQSLLYVLQPPRCPFLPPSCAHLSFLLSLALLSFHKGCSGSRWYKITEGDKHHSVLAEV